jgi:hypothetical protein
MWALERQTVHQQRQWKLDDNQNLPLSSFELACATNVGTFLLTRMTTSIFKLVVGPLDADADPDGFGVFAWVVNLVGWEAEEVLGGADFALDVDGAFDLARAAFLSRFSSSVRSRVSEHFNLPMLHPSHAAQAYHCLHCGRPSWIHVSQGAGGTMFGKSSTMASAGLPFTCVAFALPFAF